MGTVSMSLENWYEPDAPVDVWQRDERPNGEERWKEVSPPNSSRLSHLIQFGPEHFVAVLEGAEAPILTAEHATHVLEIILAAGVSIEEGCAVEVNV
jgi:predicted dehydrogenase